MNNTEIMPYIEANETSLTIPDFDQAPPVCSDQFPGLIRPGMTDEQLEDQLILASEYLGEYDANKEDYLTRTVRGETQLQILECWGAIIVKKEGMEFLNSKTGEAKQAYGVVFKLREGETFKYLGFTSISALTFMHRFVMPHPAVKGQLGDWARPIRFSVKQVEASQGHTFAFKLIRGLNS